ncbi:MAG: hypothetical protein COA79_21605 [Planctomycetota bacterium]|nr:MAG: hypothetical protein COA79_21605 [Planctomycetota bacterium]
MEECKISELKMSAFENILDTSPRPIDLEKTISLFDLDEIKKDIKYLRDHIVNGDIRKYNKEKKLLPAICYSGIFEGGKEKDNFVKESYTGLLMQDIDLPTKIKKELEKDNLLEYKDEIKEIKKKLEKDKRVLFVFISPSELGLKVLFKSNFGFENHAHFFNTTKEIIEECLNESKNFEVDKKCKNINRQHFISYDEEKYFNPECENTEVIIPEKKKVEKSKPKETTKFNQIVKNLKWFEDRNVKVSDDYGDWVQMGFLFLSLFEKENAFDLFHRFSKLSDKYNKEDTEEKLEKMLSDLDVDRAPSLGSFMKFVSNAKNEYIKNHGLNKNLKEEEAPFYVIYSIDHNSYIRINYQSNEHLYKNKESIQGEIGSVLNRLITPEDLLSIPKVRLQYWPEKDDISEIHGEELVNRFKPSPLLFKKRDSNKLVIPPIIKIMIKNNIPNKNDRMHFLNWLAGMYQNRIKSQVAWVLISVVGTGKSLIFELMRKILGEDNTREVSQTTFKSQFNEWADCKMFINLDEISLHTNDRIADRDRIKALITQPRLEINNKYGMKYETRNTFNILFTSNNSVPVNIEQGDRRFCVSDSKCSAKKLVDLLDCEPLEVRNRVLNEADEFAQALANFPFNQGLYDTALENSDKLDLIENSNSDYDQFNIALVNSDLEYFEEAFKIDSPAYNDRTSPRDYFIKECKTGKITSVAITKAFNYIFNKTFNPPALMKMLYRIGLPKNLKSKVKNHRGIVVKPFKIAGIKPKENILKIRTGE